MAIVQVITAVNTLVTAIRTKVENAKQNKGKCKNLQERINSVMIVLDKLRDSSDPNIESHINIVLVLKSCLIDCKALVEKVSNIGTLEGVWKSKSIKEQFKTLNNRISSLEQDLILSLSAVSALNGAMKSDTDRISDQIGQLTDILTAVPVDSSAPKNVENTSERKIESERAAPIVFSLNTGHTPERPKVPDKTKSVVIENNANVVRLSVAKGGSSHSIEKKVNSDLVRNDSRNHAELINDIESLKNLKQGLASGKTLLRSDFVKYYNIFDNRKLGLQLMSTDNVYFYLYDSKNNYLSNFPAIKELGKIIDSLSNSIHYKVVVDTDINNLKELKMIFACGRTLLRSDFVKYFGPLDRIGGGLQLISSDNTYFYLYDSSGNYCPNMQAMQRIGTLIDSLTTPKPIQATIMEPNDKALRVAASM